jgi:hypothetical protein
MSIQNCTFDPEGKLTKNIRTNSNLALSGTIFQLQFLPACVALLQALFQSVKPLTCRGDLITVSIRSITQKLRQLLFFLLQSFNLIFQRSQFPLFLETESCSGAFLSIPA